jgi:hypothetical protein
MNARYITPETRAQIIKDASQLTGSGNARAVKLAHKYGYSVNRLANVIREGTDAKYMGIMTESERNRIIKLFNECGIDHYPTKIVYIIKETGRSASAIKNLVNSKPQGTVFNHKQRFI